jgi:hypothetical protein
MMEQEPVRLIAIEHPRLVSEFTDLPASVWAAPSRCAGWTNAVVVGHMTYYASVYRDSIARALAGDSRPPTGPHGRVMTREEFLSLADGGQHTAAQQPPGELLREFSQSGDELTDMF